MDKVQFVQNMHDVTQKKGFAILITSKRYLHNSTHAKKPFTHTESEINKEVCNRPFCDREEIMKWGERMINGGCWNGSHVYSCMAGKDKRRQNDLWWWETDDGALEGEKWQAERKKEEEIWSLQALLPMQGIFVRFSVISRGHWGQWQQRNACRWNKLRPYRILFFALNRKSSPQETAKSKFQAFKYNPVSSTATLNRKKPCFY